MLTDIFGGYTGALGVYIHPSVPNLDAQRSKDARPQQGEEIGVVGTESNQSYGHSIVQGSDCVWAKLV